MWYDNERPPQLAQEINLKIAAIARMIMKFAEQQSIESSHGEDSDWIDVSHMADLIGELCENRLGPAIEAITTLQRVGRKKQKEKQA